MSDYQQSKMAILTDTLQQFLNLDSGTAEIISSIIIFLVVVLSWMGRLHDF